jgi:drug/metabolite transporter (DMT)-like permease
MLDYNTGVLFAFLVLVTYSIGDTFAKKIVLRFGYAKAATLVIGVSLIPFVILSIFIHSQAITVYSAELSAISGIFYGIGFVFLYKSLATEQTTNTMSLSEFFKAILVLSGVFLFGNALTGVQSTGIILIFAGSLLIITTEKFSINKKLLYALFGFLCWAVLWIMLGYAISISNSYVPEGVIATLFALASSAAYAFITRNTAPVQRVPFSLIINGYIAAVGISIGIGSLIFTFLVFSKLLSVGSAVIALTPIVVALASRRIYLDRLTLVQLFGLAIMVFGALALGLAQYLPAI